MTERERLIFLQKNAKAAYLSMDDAVISEEEFTADFLLANGVVCPPCKVGDRVYYLHEGVDRVYEGEVTSFVYVSNTNSFGIHYDGGYGVFGRYVFLTKEEAEKALKVSKTKKG